MWQGHGFSYFSSSENHLRDGVGVMPIASKCICSYSASDFALAVARTQPYEDLNSIWSIMVDLRISGTS